jgi:predicted  nucleic acid-binding Zn-ribbon protein
VEITGVIFMKEMMQTLFELQSLEFDKTIQPNTEERIAELRTIIPKPILSHYDRLGDKGKKGVALLRHQTCTGCHMRVPLAVVMELRHDDEIRQCDNCQRYLCLEEDTAEAAVEPATGRTAANKGRKQLAHAL